MLQEQTHYTVYQLGNLNLRSEIETSLWEANSAQLLFRFSLSSEVIQVDEQKYKLPNGGYALDEIVERLRLKQQIQAPAIFFTSLPLGDRASGTAPNEFWFDNYDVKNPNTSLIISTYWWEKQFKGLHVKKYALMELSGFFIWSRAGLMPHVKTKGCINDFNDDIISILECFKGNGLCLNCWSLIEARIDNGIVGLPELASALKLFYNAKDQKICFVAMPFRDEMKPIFSIIQKVLQKKNWSVLRADKMNNFKGITNAIFFGIYVADCVIADMTGKNANVAYELGIAKALSKDIYLLTQNKTLPFDLKDKKASFYGTTACGPNLVKLKSDLLHAFAES